MLHQHLMFGILIFKFSKDSYCDQVLTTQGFEQIMLIPLTIYKHLQNHRCKKSFYIDETSQLQIKSDFRTMSHYKHSPIACKKQ